MKLKVEQLRSLLKNTRLDQDGKNMYAACPKCGKDEFGISLDDNHIFGCFRKSKCGWSGNIFTLLQFLGRDKEFITEREVNIYEKVESNLNKNKIITLDPLPEVKTPLLWKRLKDDEYLRSRGFVDHQFDKFEVGRSVLNKDYITILVRMDGRLVGYVGRSNKSKKWIDAYNKKQEELGSDLVYLRYENSKSDFKKILFGIDEIIPGKTEDVILVEGILSKTKTDVNLFLDEIDEIKCCSTFGAKLSIFQIELLKRKGVKTLWFWFEADVLDKTKKIVANASKFFKVKVCYLNGKDPNDIGREEAMALIDSGRDWLNFNLNFIKSDLK